MSFHVPNQYRFRDRSHPYGSDDSAGNYGAFFIPFRGRDLKIVASAGTIDPSEGWEHVSVSLSNRCPNWEEMCFVKDLFWDPEDVVVQFHPRKSEYVNLAKYCLHLWRHPAIEFPLPPRGLVG